MNDSRNVRILATFCWSQEAEREMLVFHSLSPFIQYKAQLISRHHLILCGSSYLIWKHILSLGVVSKSCYIEHQS